MMEYKMRYFKVYEKGKYVGKCACNLDSLIRLWLADKKYKHIEVSEEEY